MAIFVSSMYISFHFSLSWVSIYIFYISQNTHVVYNLNILYLFMSEEKCFFHEKNLFLFVTKMYFSFELGLKSENS